MHKSALLGIKTSVAAVNLHDTGPYKKQMASNTGW